MATPRDFMARVVAWPADDEAGYVNLHWLPPDKDGKKQGMRGRAYRGLDNFMGMAGWCATHPEAAAHTYFCLSTQPPGNEVNGNRRAVRSTQTAITLKAIWLDVDAGPGKGYPSADAALDDVARFIAAAQLPPFSALVSSGSGLHVYWISDRPLTPGEWRSYAEGLKAEALKHGLKCDAGLTTDAARVLRVPGTLNHKTTPPQPVILRHLGEACVFASTLARLRELGAQAPAVLPAGNILTPGFDLTGWGPPPEAFLAAGLTAETDNLTAGLRDTTPLAPAEIFKDCPHFNKLVSTTHGADEQQGVWMLDVLACTFMEDGEQLAHDLSKGYSAYSRDDTQEMWERKLADKARGIGWPSCSSFEAHGCKECATCPRRGRIKSPLNLAARKQSISVGAGAALPPTPAALLPDTYTIHNGIVCKIKAVKVKDGEPEDQLFPLFRCTLKDFQARKGDGDAHGLAFKVHLGGDEWEPVHVPQSIMHSQHDLYAKLGRSKVLLNAANKVWVEDFMTSFLQKMDLVNARLNTVPFGWFMQSGVPQGFAYGGKLFLNDGSERESGFVDQATERVFSPNGKPDPWFEAVKIITSQHRPALESIVCLAFAAPLMIIPALYNGAFIFRSQRGGAHKSTALAVGLSVWASPHKAKETITSTVRSMMNRLGSLSNLPMFLDEINNRERFGAIEQFLNQTTEGVGPSRLNSNIEQREKETWQTIIGLGTNADFWGYLKQANKNSDAMFHRVFQIEVKKIAGPHNQLAVDQLILSLNHNYGHAGLRYAKYIATHYDEINAWTSSLRNSYAEANKIRDEERFRTALLVTIVAGARFANACLGTDFHVDEIYKFLHGEFMKARREIDQMSVVAGSPEHVEGVVDQFLTQFGANTVWTDSMPVGAGKPRPVHQLSGPARNDTPIFIRCSVEDRKIIFKTQIFEEFCDACKIEAGETLRALKLLHGAKHARATVAKGTQYPVGTAVNVIEIPVKLDGPFADHLYAHTDDDKRPRVEDEGISSVNTLPGPVLGLIHATVPLSPVGPTGASAPV